MYLFFIAPQTVPELIVTTALSPISIYIEWAAINVNLANEAITHYQVMWKRLHCSSNYIQLLDNDTRQYTITGNSPFLSITFKTELLNHISIRTLKMQLK